MHRNLTTPDGEKVCGEESTAQYAYMAGGRYCSLPPEHVNDPGSSHIAYHKHQVTGNGIDVIWLGPWEDGRPYQGPESERLQAEWNNRPDSVFY